MSMMVGPTGKRNVVQSGGRSLVTEDFQVITLSINNW